MIHWGWLILAYMVGSITGFILIALLTANKED